MTLSGQQPSSSSSSSSPSTLPSSSSPPQQSSTVATEEASGARWAIGACLAGSVALVLFTSASNFTSTSTLTLFVFAAVLFIAFAFIAFKHDPWISGATLGVALFDVLLTLATVADRDPRDPYYLWFGLVPLVVLYARGPGSCAAALVLVLVQTSLLRYYAATVAAVATTTTLAVASSSGEELSRHSILGAGVWDGWLLVAVTVCAVANRDSRDRLLAGRLRTALAEGARATKAKSDFLANISHELRTPMHGIVAMSGELQAMVQPNSKASHALAIITDCADHLLSLVNDLLDVERIEAHRLELESVPFSAAHETYKVINMLRSTAEEKRLELSTRLSVDPHHHVGDPVRFRQILFSLLSNAIKFTPEGGAISVTLTCDADAPLELTVRDTGIGISEQHMAHIFSCFAQADGSVCRRYGGSGLGLALSKRLCDAMGGSISVASQLGQGSTFTVTLPLRRVSDAAVDDTAAVDCGAQRERKEKEEQDDVARHHAQAREHMNTLKGLEVLLVEDNLINQKVGKRMLHSLGCVVTVVENGIECVKCVEHRAATATSGGPKLDVVLMDCQMPLMDGFEATQRIRELEQKAARADPGLHATPLPIIALTASAIKEYGDKCIAVGMSDVLFKPLRREVLAAALSKWAPPRFSARTPNAPPSPASSSPAIASMVTAIATTATKTTKTAAVASTASKSKSHASLFPIAHSSPIPLHSSASFTSSASSSPESGSAPRTRSRSLPLSLPPSSSSPALSPPSAVSTLRETLASHHPARRLVPFTRKEST